MKSYILITVNESKVVNAQTDYGQIFPTPTWYPEINCVECPSGPEPGYGKFLISCTDYEDNWPEEDPFRIDMQRKCGEDITTIQLDGYSTVAAYRADRKPGGPWVVEVADARFFMRTATTTRFWNVGSTDETWQDVLDDLISDLPVDGAGGFVGELEYAVTPEYDLVNLKYEGWRTLDALADLASRTGHVLVYDPFLVSLKFEPMSGNQGDITEIINGAKIHRQYDSEDIPADGIGEVRVSYDVASGTPAEYVDVLNPDPDSTASQRASAWSTSIVIDPTDIAEETVVLSQTWFDWSARAKTRTTFEYFGNLEVPPGSEVSTSSWIIRDNEIYTFVDKYAPPEPTTTRQDNSGISGLKIGITDEVIAAGSSGVVSIWVRNASDVLVDTGVNIVASYLDWLTEEDISEGIEVLLGWFPDEGPSGIWRIIGAECEPPEGPDVIQVTSTNEPQLLTGFFKNVSGMALTYSSGTAILATAPAAELTDSPFGPEFSPEFD